MNAARKPRTGPGTAPCGRPRTTRPGSVAIRLRWRPLAALLWSGVMLAGSSEVVVIYNLDVEPESRLVAEHYAQRRAVPTNQVLGLHLPRGEYMSRTDFAERLAKPLLEILEQRGLWSLHHTIIPAAAHQPGRVVRAVNQSKIRYAALCYGVPVGILEDKNAARPARTNVPAGLQRNQAAVDSELALLPRFDRADSADGLVSNPFLGTTNFAQLNPVNGLLMVARLDGPSPAIARGLVDKALAAETNGLWGRAYFDARGLTNGGYLAGDEWIVAASETTRRQGYETVVDRRGATFSAGFPLSHVAFYAGWYDQAPSGPFKQDTVEFMPGAIAYHLFSYSARSIRMTNTWVGTLLGQGAAATVGYVHEPYLAGTIDVGRWFGRMLEEDATLAEAAYAALPALSWQSTVIGDPLYRPGRRPPPAHSVDSDPRTNPLAPWARLKEVNLRLVRGEATTAVARDLANDPVVRGSALLQEKLGDLHQTNGNRTESLQAYRAALALQPSPQQRIRLELGTAQLLAALQRLPEAVDAYEEFCRQHPLYPEPLTIYRKALPLARKLGRDSLVQRYEAEIDRLSPAARATNAPPPSTTNAAPQRPPP